MKGEIPLQKLHIRLLKQEVRRVDAALEDSSAVKRYGLRQGLGFGGRLYVAPPNQSPPPWLEFVQTGTSETLTEMTNRTNAAVLVLRVGKRVFALTFGHGRHLLKQALLVPDFGLKTALNGLRHDSLRSLDAFSLEEQTIHRRAQASKASGLEVFGLDIGRDILRAVTGTPRDGVSSHTLAGAESALAVSARVDFEGLGRLCQELLGLYRKRTYKESFSWVDNVRRSRDHEQIEALNQRLIADLERGADTSAYLAPPEPLEWVNVDGFSYSRRRQPIESDLAIEHYLSVTDPELLDADRLRRDHVFLYRDQVARPAKQWSIFKCLVFEVQEGNRRFVLSNGEWFEVDRSFAESVQRYVAEIPTAEVDLPAVQRLADGKPEPEGEYNKRVAQHHAATALLDGITLRCGGASSGIEPCDLLTENGALIHVKHRKGGSSSLSHLFAQGRLASEALVGDPEFRRQFRTSLRKLDPSWEGRIPLNRPNPQDFEVVFAILGAQNPQPADDLPFFSQLNLRRTAESLVSRGFRVSVRGVQIAGPG